MSIKLNRIINIIEKIAPKNLAESWDNVGLQLGDPDHEVRKILLTLDVTKNVVEEAVEQKVDLILSHHPFIFKGLKTLSFDTEKGRMIKTLIQNDMAIYVAHTNLDKAELGLNNYVAKRLGLKEIESLFPAENMEVMQEITSDHGLGKIGNLETPLLAKELVDMVKRKLEIEDVFGAGKLPEEIKRVGLCTGSGADLMNVAKFNQADVFITGDLKYHDGQRAEELGLWLLNAGHFGTEKWVSACFEEILEKELKKKCPVLIKSQASKGFFEKYE